MPNEVVKRMIVTATAPPNPDTTYTTQVALYKADGTPYPIPTKQVAQADSVASTVAALVTDFNALLAKLRLAGILS